MSSEESNVTDDEDFVELAILLAFPRKRKMFLERPNHFTKWRDEQFFNFQTYCLLHTRSY